MQPGELAAGIVAGLDGAADWVDEAKAERIEIVLMMEQLPRVIDHLTIYLDHEATIGHANRQRWIDALQTASQL